MLRISNNENKEVSGYMKKYNIPLIEYVCMASSDVITLSPLTLIGSGDADIELDFPNA